MVGKEGERGDGGEEGIGWRAEGRNDKAGGNMVGRRGIGEMIGRTGGRRREMVGRMEDEGGGRGTSC